MDQRTNVVGQVTTDTGSDANNSSPRLDAQVQIINAYIEADNAIAVQLSNPLNLPLNIHNFTVRDSTAGDNINIEDITYAQMTEVILVGDLQMELGAQGNWYPNDKATMMQRVHANLYQFTGTLPAGTYHYKVAFNGRWDGTFPDQNSIVTIPADNTEVTFSFIPFDLQNKQSQLYDTINNPDIHLPTSSDGVHSDVVALKVADVLNLSHVIDVELQGDKQVYARARNVLNAPHYTYTGDDLGNIYRPHLTTFRLWAPTASDVHVLLYTSETGPLTQNVALHSDRNGTWYGEIYADLKDWYYLYEVTIHGVTNTAVDPYVRAVAVNAQRGMIVDLRETDPAGWNDDRYITPENMVDAIIYELHVRDFSIHQNSGMSNRGKYLAFTERGTRGPANVATGVDSLLELGISHVQILPVERFESIDETNPNQYNWGYDPDNYNVPEGAYATTPHGTARISEVKQMIQSLHAARLGVIMDVVYNHSFAIRDSDFDKIVPQYYYRTDYAGHYTNGSGVGNELATERPMVEKFVRDSLKYWATEYHVDGFRFDLMALIGVDTMGKVLSDLHAIEPHMLVYGEPWTGNISGLPASQLLIKGRQRGMKLGVFNDTIRNALSGNVFDTNARGFATGGHGMIDVIKTIIMGSLDEFTDAPGETINYVTSHDNYTLWDKIANSNPNDNEDDRISMDELAQAVVLTSQGVAFLQGGEEMLRTKGGNGDSYNAGDAVNQFDWERKSQYRAVFDYYADLIHLRTHHPAFRMRSAEQIRTHLSFLPSPDNTIEYLISDHANGDSWKNILVIFNPNKAYMTFYLPEGDWTIVGNHGQIGENPLGQATGTITVAGITCAILYQN